MSIERYTGYAITNFADYDVLCGVRRPSDEDVAARAIDFALAAMLQPGSELEFRIPTHCDTIGHVCSSKCK